MKKLFLSSLILLLACSTAFAYTQQTVAKERGWSTLIVDNAAADYLTTDVSKDTIKAGRNHILGYQIISLAGGSSENVAALHDAESTDLYVDESMIDEDEIADGGHRTDPWFAFPRKLNVALRVVQGAYTRVIIYYTS